MEYDIKALKASSLIKQKEPDLFSVRVRTVGVRVEATRLKGLTELAEKCTLDDIQALRLVTFKCRSTACCWDSP